MIYTLTTIFSFIIFVLIIPLLCSFFLIKIKYKSIIHFLLAIISFTLYSYLLYSTFPWGLYLLYMKYIYISIIFIIAIFVFLKSKAFILNFRIHNKHSHLSSLIFLSILNIVLFALLIDYYYIRNNKGNYINLTFPLHGSNYYILDGGNSIISNQHNYLKFQHYAIDIVKLNKYSSHSSGLFSYNNTNSEIFGNTIYSPCNGIVIDFMNTIPDNNYGFPNKNAPAGNYVLLKTDLYYVLLAHFKINSIIVHKNQKVFSGEKLGEVGNSGNSIFPHLHIHAVSNINSNLLFSGNSISISFNNTFLKRNDIVNNIP